MKELTEQQVAGMSRKERVRVATELLKRLPSAYRKKVRSEIPQIVDFLEGRTSTCKTSCGPGSPELAELSMADENVPLRGGDEPHSVGDSSLVSG